MEYVEYTRPHIQALMLSFFFLHHRAALLYAGIVCTSHQLRGAPGIYSVLAPLGLRTQRSPT